MMSERKVLLQFKWAMLAFVGWNVVLSILADQASQNCIRQPGPFGSGWHFDFLECSPHLLAGGPLDIILLVWAWAGLVFPALLALLIRYTVREMFFNSKEP